MLERARGSRACRGLAVGVGPSGRGAKVLAPALGHLREGSVASSSARDPSLWPGALWCESKADSAEVPPPFGIGPNWEGSRSRQLPRGWRPLGQCWGKRTDRPLLPVRLGRSHWPGAPPSVGPFQQLPRPLHQGVNSRQGGQPSEKGGILHALCPSLVRTLARGSTQLQVHGRH